MKIRSNTVGNSTPRTNWEQTDPTMADYLKGRDALEMLIQKTGEDAKTAAVAAANEAKTAAGKAQTTADNANTAAGKAQTAADNAQTTANNAVSAAKNAQDTADGKTACFNQVVTLEAGKWADNRQKVSVVGVTVDVNQPIIISSDSEAFSYYGVKPADQGENAITFSCDTVPDTDIAVKVIGFTTTGSAATGSATPSNGVVLTDQATGKSVALYVSDGNVYIA